MPNEIRERDKKGILLELENRFNAIEIRQERLKSKIEEFKEELNNSRLKGD